MTEVGVASADPNNDNTAGAQSVSSAGQLLRHAREQQHMSVQALASALKVPAYKLQALEDDRWDVLTDSVFTRALALSVCRLLRISPDAVLAGLPKHEAAKLASNPEGINAPFKDKTLRSLMSSSQDSSSDHGVKVMAALLIAVAVGAGLYFLPQWQQGEGAEAEVAAVVVEEPLPTPAADAADAASTTSAAPAVALVTEALPAPVVQEAVAAPAAPVATVEPAASVAPTAPVVETAPVAAAVLQPVAERATGQGRVLRFTTSGDSWVQVRNAQQQVLLEKMLKSGDVLEETLSGHPLQVVVGNAGATKLEVDGVTLDVAASARNNVTRLEVK